MTAATLLDNALALLLTTSSQTPEYTDSALPLINMLLAEVTPANDMLRAQKGLAPSGVPLLADNMEAPLACEEELARAALPYGLCAKLLMDDDDMAKVAWFQNQFVQAAWDSAGVVAAPVADCYPGGGAV